MSTTTVIANPAIVQQALYTFPNDFVQFVTSTASLNIGGFGAAPVLTVASAVSIPAGAVIGFKLTTPYPCGILSFATLAATTNYSWYTNDNMSISLDSVTNTSPIALTGVNNRKFQPGNGEIYTVFIENTSSTAITAGTVLAYIQLTVQNTLGTFVDQGSIALTNKLTDSQKEYYCVSGTTFDIKQQVLWNSTSAVPNAYAVSVMNYPVIKGITIAPITFRCLKETLMLYSTTGDTFATTGSPNGWRELKVIANTRINLEVGPADADGLWSGTIIFGFSNIGITTQLITLSIPAAILPFDSMNRNVEESGYIRRPMITGPVSNGVASDHKFVLDKIVNMMTKLSTRLNQVEETLITHIINDKARYSALTDNTPRRESRAQMSRFVERDIDDASMGGRC